MTSTPEWPTFSKQYTNDVDPGLRFHEFVGELFGPDYKDKPGFVTFLNAGKDGAIDCFHAEGVVWECKYVGEAGYSAATARWQEVIKHLHENLLPDKPKSSQYRPWYNATSPIQRYYFCTSNTLENTARLEELETLIRKDLSALSQRAGLAHLKLIKVEVWSWDRLSPKLQHHPHLRLKWFPNPVPAVFKSLAVWMQNYRKGFRAYLTEDVLPYVALPAEELAPARILAAFLENDAPCSVLSGIGGAGKSRLLAETATLAQQQGWLVYMPNATVTAADITGLARLLSDKPVFIGLDYLEKCAQFEQVLDAVYEANESGKQLYLSATCRQSYWHQVDQLRLRQFSLANLALQDVVRRILGPALQEFAPECGNVPVFAAFVRFLSDTNQTAALQELRAAPAFTTWLIDHILKAGNAAQRLQPIEQARLMLMLPASEGALQQLEREIPALAAWRSVLEADGWLLSESSTESDGGLLWQTAHDVIADGTLLRALADAGNRQANVVRLLASARKCNAVPAALQTLQRIAQETNAHGVDWLQAFAAEKQQWRDHVDAILASRLLSLGQNFPFLNWYQADTAQLAVSDVVQGTLGFITRAVVKGDLMLDHDQESALEIWLAAAVRQVGSANFVLTQALRWRPVQFKAMAHTWLTSHPPEYQTHFLLTAWLNAANKLGNVAMGQEVAEQVTAWLAMYARWPHAAFVTVAWLNAKQDPMIVIGAIGHWLEIKGNRIAPEAHFVFKSWLDAKQDTGVVKAAVIDWLTVEQNRIAPDAHFVFKSWLDATQDADVVKAAIIDWLTVEQNRIAPDAGFVFKSWLDATQDAGVVKAAVIDWLTVEQNRIAPEAHFVFKSWLDATQDAGVVKAAVIDWLTVEQNRIAPDAGFVFKSWLNAKQSHALIQQHVLAWLAHGDNGINPGADFIYRAWGDRFKYLDDAMFPSACRWLQANRHQADAGYCMKYIAGDRRLDQATASAIIDWLTAFSTHEDAPSRLCRLRYHTLSHLPSAALTKLYVTILSHYIERAEHFGEWDVKTAFYLFVNAVRIAKRPALETPSRLPLARAFCRLLRKLSSLQMQHLSANLPKLTGGALPGLIRLALQNAESFDDALASQTRWLQQAYASLGEIGANDAALLRQMIEKYGPNESTKSRL
jgi:hypothetical protein